MPDPIPFPVLPRPEPCPYENETRSQRAARLRPDVAALVKARGARAVAQATGLSESAVRAFARGRCVPLWGALDAYVELLTADAGLGGDKPPARPATGRRYYMLEPVFALGAAAACRARGGRAPRSPGEGFRAALPWPGALF